MTSANFCMNLTKILNRQALQKLSSPDSTRQFSVSSTRKMRFVQYRLKTGGQQQLGAQIAAGGDIFDISAVDSSIPNSPDQIPGDGKWHLREGQEYAALGAPVCRVSDNACSTIVAAGKSITPLENVELLSPITKPDKVACVGLNYSGHCKEQNIEEPKEPMIFSKFSSCIVGPHDNVVIPPITNSVDWEVELAVVIGRKAKAIRREQVNDYIFGYTVAQDISARDWQKKRNNGQFLLGKSMDTFCPLGPAIVTKNKLDVNNLDIKTWVNGVLKQNGNTSELIFKIDFLVSYLSQIVTLYPGDVILTGTPAGVGMYRNPPEFLKKGDILESEIEGIGRLKNVIV
ncbi:hypothetical protein NQ318_005128 [Aromia moschata]|uniref:Fumarylacetoacetase-like C-terminal domain-containing protein n=1 Tax=Aromia moschata TaxID=1265417 RepID=A0AAV8XRZ7_9CUCU|nr:hypothetical protein NQ318_005128 [Aromia moschata]